MQLNSLKGNSFLFVFEFLHVRRDNNRMACSVIYDIFFFKAIRHTIRLSRLRTKMEGAWVYFSPVCVLYLFLFYELNNWIKGAETKAGKRRFASLLLAMIDYRLSQLLSIFASKKNNIFPLDRTIRLNSMPRNNLLVCSSCIDSNWCLKLLKLGLDCPWKPQSVNCFNGVWRQ